MLGGAKVYRPYSAQSTNLTTLWVRHFLIFPIPLKYQIAAFSFQWDWIKTFAHMERPSKFENNTTSVLYVVWDKPHECIKSGSSYLSYLPNKLATLIALPALGKVILVLKRYLSSCLKEGLRPLTICAPWTGGKLKWSIINLAFERVSPTLWLWNIFDVFKCVNDNQIEILSAHIANGICFMRLLCYFCSRISYYIRAPLFPT